MTILHSIKLREDTPNNAVKTEVMWHQPCETASSATKKYHGWYMLHLTPGVFDSLKNVFYPDTAHAKKVRLLKTRAYIRDYDDAVKKANQILLKEITKCGYEPILY